MNRREKAKFERLLEGIARVTNTDLDEIKEKASVATLYSEENLMYEAQSVYNFFVARIKPRLEAKEKEADYEKRFNEWKIRTCKDCNLPFAYAWEFDSITFCSLDCAEAGLRKVGITMNRSADLKRRWWYSSHPAIVPSSALAAYRNLYGDGVLDENADSPLIPNNLEETQQTHTTNIELEQGNQYSSV